MATVHAMLYELLTASCLLVRSNCLIVEIEWKSQSSVAKPSSKAVAFKDQADSQIVSHYGFITLPFTQYLVFLLLFIIHMLKC